MNGQCGAGKDDCHHRVTPKPKTGAPQMQPKPAKDVFGQPFVVDPHRSGDGIGKRIGIFCQDMVLVSAHPIERVPPEIRVRNGLAAGKHQTDKPDGANQQCPFAGGHLPCVGGRFDD
ncbi:MAG: hypothetical protein WCO86_19285 [Planctomycetota bacterium]